MDSVQSILFLFIEKTFSTEKKKKEKWIKLFNKKTVPPYFFPFNASIFFFFSFSIRYSNVVKNFLTGQDGPGPSSSLLQHACHQYPFYFPSISPSQDSPSSYYVSLFSLTEIKSKPTTPITTTQSEFYSPLLSSDPNPHS